MARRILLLITDLKIGGTPTVVRELAIRLNRPPEVVVEVACLDAWGPVADQLQSAGITVTALNARGPWDLGVFVRLIGLVGRGQFDTVFSFLIHANFAAAVAATRFWRVRFIQSVQTTQPTPRWHWRLQRLAHRMADRVVAPSASAAEAARVWSKAPADKLVVIPNAIDAEDFGGEKSSESETDQIKGSAETKGSDPFAAGAVVGFIGRLDPIKRIVDLLDAVALLDSSVRLEIFGEGSERTRLQAHVDGLGLQSRVTFRGAVARPQLALAAIDLLVLPSDAEGFGLVLIEAMAAGTPVVATNVPGIRDVVIDGRTGLLVPARDPKALAAAIRRVLRDDGLRLSMIAAARADVRERFSWAAVIAQYRQLLQLT
jgi:glycosyltransferase involved in cell wall biosynthesis